MAIRQLSVFLNDVPGTLADLARILLDAQINLRALSVADARDFAIVRMITDRPDDAAHAFEQAGYACSVRDVLALRIEDRPGAMYELLRELSEAGVNIDYSYAFTTPRNLGACMVVRVAHPDEAQHALEKAGTVELLSEEDLSRDL